MFYIYEYYITLLERYMLGLGCPMVVYGTYFYDIYD